MSSTKQTVSIVSLGCARNLVDSEVMGGLLRQNRFELVPEPAGADIVLVNTCGFIEAAKAESLDTILEIARLNKHDTFNLLAPAPTDLVPRRHVIEAIERAVRGRAAEGCDCALFAAGC